jgi:hypothetical protein
MKHSMYYYLPAGTEPEISSVTWNHPIAWNAQGKPTHFTHHPAFISFKLLEEDGVLVGSRVCVRKCSLNVDPPTFA